jgi:hypothetical protein
MRSSNVAFWPISLLQSALLRLWRDWASLFEDDAGNAGQDPERVQITGLNDNACYQPISYMYQEEVLAFGICDRRLTAILRSAHTGRSCVLCGSQNKQRLFHCTAKMKADQHKGQCVILCAEFMSVVTKALSNVLQYRTPSGTSITTFFTEFKEIGNTLKQTSLRRRHSGISSRITSNNCLTVGYNVYKIHPSV